RRPLLEDVAARVVGELECVRGARRAGRSLRALRPLCAGKALEALEAPRPLLALRPLGAGRAGVARIALLPPRALRPGRTGRTGVAFGALRALQALRALRPGLAPRERELGRAARASRVHDA